MNQIQRKKYIRKDDDKEESTIEKLSDEDNKEIGNNLSNGRPKLEDAQSEDARCFEGQSRV